MRSIKIKGEKSISLWVYQFKPKIFVKEKNTSKKWIKTECASNKKPPKLGGS